MFFTLVYQNLHRFTGTNYFWRRRIIFASTIFLLLVSELYQLKENEPLGLEFLNKMSYLLAFLFMILAPLSCANAFHEEKNQNTLAVLIMTKLSFLDILLSKLLSQSIIMIFYLLGTLPIFMICFSFGGISASQVFYIFIGLTTFIFFSSCVGLLFAVIGFAKSYTASIANIIVFSLFLFINNFFSMNLNSWSSIQLFLSGNTSLYACQGIFLEIIYCYLCIVLNRSLFKFTSLAPEKISKNNIRIEFQNRLINFIWYQNSSNIKERKDKDQLFTNPIEWKDYYFLHYPRFSRQRISCLLCILLFSFIFVPVLYALFLIIFVAMLLVGGIKSFAQESRSFETLLMTPMSNQHIIRGKLYAIYKGLNWFTKILTTIFVVVSIATIYALPLTILAIINTVSVLVLIVITAMFCAFCNPKPVAAITSSAIIVIISQSILFAIFSINVFLGALLVPVCNFIIVYSFYQYMTQNLRTEKFTNRYYVR